MPTTAAEKAPQQQLALDRDVDHAGAFAEHAGERAEDQRHGQRDGTGQQADEGPEFGVAGAADHPGQEAEHEERRQKPRTSQPGTRRRCRANQMGARRAASSSTRADPAGDQPRTAAGQTARGDTKASLGADSRKVHRSCPGAPMAEDHQERQDGEHGQADAGLPVSPARRAGVPALPPGAVAQPFPVPGGGRGVCVVLMLHLRSSRRRRACRRSHAWRSPGARQPEDRPHQRRARR